jgi:cold-inducible RNA-binding protein
MAKKLFVGNISFDLNQDQFTEIFAAYGTVLSANIVMDKFSGRSKGFGFVEFEKDEDAVKAMTELNDSDQMGRKIAVKEAIPRPEQSTTEQQPVAEQPVETEASAPVSEEPVTEETKTEEVVEETPVATEEPVAEETETEEADETEEPVAEEKPVATEESVAEETETTEKPVA